MSLEFDLACLRAPIEPGDTLGVVQLIGRAKMAADQIESLTAQRDELLAALAEVSVFLAKTQFDGVSDEIHAENMIEKINLLIGKHHA